MKRGLSKFHLIGLFIIVFVVSIMLIVSGSAQDCIDSDGGANYYVRGDAKVGNLPQARVTAAEDSCDGDFIIEAVCENGAARELPPFKCLVTCEEDANGFGECIRDDLDRDGVGGPQNPECSDCTDCDDNNPNVQGEIPCSFDGNSCGRHSLCVESCPTPPQEVCDSIDNDCDGVNNNGFNVGDICSNGVGECVEPGEFVCKVDGSGTECNAVPVGPVPELCDGLDNNCDGVSDETFRGNIGETAKNLDECCYNIERELGKHVCSQDGSGLTCDTSVRCGSADVGLCKVNFEEDCTLLIDGKIGGDDNDLSLACPAGHIAKEIKIVDFNVIPIGKSVADYKILCCPIR